MFYIKVVEKIKTHILFSITVFRKSCRIWDYVEKYGGAREATDDVTVQRIRFLCWINKAAWTQAPRHLYIARTHTHTYTQISNSYWFSSATISRERVSVLRYTNIVCLATLEFVLSTSYRNFELEWLQFFPKWTHERIVTRTVGILRTGKMAGIAMIKPQWGTVRFDRTS
jgi:hypothetical protein